MHPEWQTPHGPKEAERAVDRIEGATVRILAKAGDLARVHAPVGLRHAQLLLSPPPVRPRLVRPQRPPPVK